jgi:GH15 family glucan-1,4-alpha-glucosidase
MRLASFLLQYQEDHLPKPSYDLWEEGWGIHIYTVATVIRALKDEGHDVGPMTSAMLKTFFHDGYFHRNINDPRPDASSLYIGLLGILPIDDPRVQSNANHVRQALWVHDGIGGLARYPGDYYFRQNDRHPGNPWIICTLWLAQHEAMSGRAHRCHELLDWVRRYADPTGILSEQLHPETGSHLSVSPLTWSHAEYLRTIKLLG